MENCILADDYELREKVQRAESDLVQNRRWNRSSEALNWLNTYHSQNKMGLGFVNQRVYKPVIASMLGFNRISFAFTMERLGIIVILVLSEKDP